MNKKKILFVVEGEKMERSNIENVARNMFGLLKENYEIVSYGTTIYELYEKLAEDPFLSLIGLLTSMNKIVLEPGELSKQAFSQIYLVFDFDPNYQKYSDSQIRELLDFFQNETENGKIYINYPMFEAAFYLDDFNNPQKAFEYVKIEDCVGSIFKKKVREISCFGKKNHLDFKLSQPKYILQCIKWNYLRQQRLTGQEEIDYRMILEKQIESKNSDMHQIMVLSTFILMIVDYNSAVLEEIKETIGL